MLFGFDGFKVAHKGGSIITRFGVIKQRSALCIRDFTLTCYIASDCLHLCLSLVNAYLLSSSHPILKSKDPS